MLYQKGHFMPGSPRHVTRYRMLRNELRVFDICTEYVDYHTCSGRESQAKEQTVA